MTLYMIAIAFSAGIISAMVGAFQECMLAGLVMVAMTAFPQYSFLGDTVSYGLFPYIAFTGGVVATAYASKVRKHDLGGAAILTKPDKVSGHLRSAGCGGGLDPLDDHSLAHQ